MVKTKVGITDTTLRDAHQSLLATRMTIDDILTIASDLDKVGFHSMEVWGGATFDSCMRFLNEDPWERLRKIRKACPNTKLQMLLRGQNLLGYRHYSDDVVDLFVQKCVENGIDIIRIFDALNDVRNVESAVRATKIRRTCCRWRFPIPTAQCTTRRILWSWPKKLKAWVRIVSALRI